MNKRSLSYISVAAVLLVVSSCAFSPEEINSPVATGCKLESKELRLKLHTEENACKGSGEAAIFCLVGAGVIASATLVVSGTVVVIGNTAHWLEKSLRCSDTEIEDGRKEYLEKINKV